MRYIPTGEAWEMEVVDSWDCLDDQWQAQQKDVFSKDVLTFEQPSEFNNDKIRTNVFSIVGGVDINLQKFVIGVRLGWDVQNNNADASSSTPHYKNAWAQATLGFKIF